MGSERDQVELKEDRVRIETDRVEHEEDRMEKTAWVSLLSGRPPEEKNDGPYALVTGADGLVRPAWALRSDALRTYYDTEWGGPIESDEEMFKALAMLILQGGMRWGTVVGRAGLFGEMLADFDFTSLSQFTSSDVERILANPKMIRNRRKLEAIVQNAKATSALSDTENLAKLVWGFRPETTPIPLSGADLPRASEESTMLANALRERGFTFVGPRLCYSLFQCAGVVDGNPVGAWRRGSSGLWNADGTRARRLPLEPVD